MQHLFTKIKLSSNDNLTLTYADLVAACPPFCVCLCVWPLFLPIVSFIITFVLFILFNFFFIGHSNTKQETKKNPRKIERKTKLCVSVNFFRPKITVNHSFTYLFLFFGFQPDTRRNDSESVKRKPTISNVMAYHIIILILFIVIHLNLNYKTKNEKKKTKNKKPIFVCLLCSGIDFTNVAPNLYLLWCCNPF